MQRTNELSGSYKSSAAWQKAMELTDVIYGVTRDFPGDERFGLTNQLRRAAVSIASNIAEGNGRLSRGELRQFLGIARGSTLEVLTQLEIALRQGFGKVEELRKAELLAFELLRILNASFRTMRAGSPQNPT